MKRRTLLRFGMAIAAGVITGNAAKAVAADGRLLLADLEPDGMWPVYRRYRLLIVGQRDDDAATAFAEAITDVLASFLPDSRARLARATDTRRVGVLIGTHQQDVAIMTAQGAEALFLAKPPFEDVRSVPLRVIVSFGSHLLVCREDLMDHHVFLFARTLVEHADGLPKPAAPPGGVVPAHRGSLAFFAGEQLPAPAGAA
jgi:hypothetical protein